MKIVLSSLVGILLSMSANAEEQPGTITLECKGQLQDIYIKEDGDLGGKPIDVNIKISGPNIFRRGARMAYDLVEVNYGKELITVKDVRSMPEFHLYELIQPKDGLFLTDFNWYQSFENTDGSKFVTGNDIKIVGLPKTMQTQFNELDDDSLEIEVIHSTFEAQVEMNITNGNEKVDYTAHTAEGQLSCAFDQN